MSMWEDDLDSAWRLSLEDADGRLRLTTIEAARFLRVSEVTLRMWRKKGRADRPQPSGWNGSARLYLLSDLRAFRDAGPPT